MYNCIVNINLNLCPTTWAIVVFIKIFIALVKTWIYGWQIEYTIQNRIYIQISIQEI